MRLTVYQQKYQTYEELDRFQDIYFSYGKKHLASDLLTLGLSPKQILAAVKKATIALQNSGESKRKHFLPVYSERRGQIIRDCKLSDLGKAFVMINADPRNPKVAKLQLQLCKQMLTKQEVKL